MSSVEVFRLTEQVQRLEAENAELAAERDLLLELANARDVADYRAWLAEDVTP